MRGLFPNAAHIARREYLMRVRSRSFAITTAVLAVVGIAMALFPVGLAAIIGDPTSEVAVHAVDGALPDPVAALEPLLPEDAGVELTATDDPEAAGEAVRAEELDGLLTISRDDTGELAFSLMTDAGPADPEVGAVRAATSQLTVGDRLARIGVAPEEAAGLFAPTAFELAEPDPEDIEPGEDFGARYGLSFVLVLITFIAIMTYGNWVAASVVEEKASRVMELLITAATPRQLLFGKVFGTGAAALTQLAAIVVAAAVGLVLQGFVASALDVEAAAAEFPSLSPAILAVFAVFFLLGFALFATLYAGVGSTVSRQEDLQQVVGPMIFLSMIGYFIFFFAVGDPDAEWVGVASFIPFVSPYLMPTRLIFDAVEPWELVVAIVLLTATAWVGLMLAARIYSAGVLLYGQRPGIRKMLRAARVAR